MKGEEGREGSEGQSHKEEKNIKEVEWERDPGPLAREGGLYLNICTGVPPSSYSYATAAEASLPYLARAGLKSQSAPVSEYRVNAPPDTMRSFQRLGPCGLPGSSPRFLAECRKRLALIFGFTVLY